MTKVVTVVITFYALTCANTAKCGSLLMDYYYSPLNPHSTLETRFHPSHPTPSSPPHLIPFAREGTEPQRREVTHLELPSIDYRS